VIPGCVPVRTSRAMLRTRADLVFGAVPIAETPTAFQRTSRVFLLVLSSRRYRTFSPPLRI
jgi:hypothetical protein